MAGRVARYVCTIEDCTKAHYARGWCETHYTRWLVHRGDPRTVGGRRPVVERFWPKVDRSGECWEWRGSRNALGYGQFAMWPDSPQAAHRVAWTLTNGVIPARSQVNHRCDNPPCVRPDHLFLGSQSDNMRDMVAKGRNRNQFQAQP